jgi:hypothetical protein
MINLTIDDGFSSRQKTDIANAVSLFANSLGLGRINFTLDVERNLRSDVQGECVSEEEKKNPRWFTITLRGKKSDEDMIKTLAHEMVHVKQYIRNELSKQFRLTRKGIGIGSKWMGEFWDPKKHEDPYWDCPWEIEAYGREVGLYHKWIAYNEQISN